MIRLAMETSPSLEAVNPYLGLIFCHRELTSQVALERRRMFARTIEADIYHMHWPDHILWAPKVHRFGPAVDAAFRALVSGMDRLRARGGKVVWTAHNLRPHDIAAHKHGARWARWEPELLSRVDAVVAMSETVAREVRAALPVLNGARFEVIPHPHYRELYGRHKISKRDARKALGLPEAGPVLGLLGMVRRYKDPLGAIEAFRSSGVQGTLLVAGGCFDEALRKDIAHAIRGDTRFVWVDKELSTADYVAAAGACDLLLHNFAASLNSGSVIAALSLDRPVMAPALGAAIDLGAQVGPDWMHIFEPPLTPESLAGAIAALPPAGDTAPHLAPNEPARVAKAHVALYKALTVQA